MSLSFIPYTDACAPSAPDLLDSKSNSRFSNVEKVGDDMQGYGIDQYTYGILSGLPMFAFSGEW